MIMIFNKGFELIDIVSNMQRASNSVGINYRYFRSIPWDSSDSKVIKGFTFIKTHVNLHGGYNGPRIVI